MPVFRIKFVTLLHYWRHNRGLSVNEAVMEAFDNAGKEARKDRNVGHEASDRIVTCCSVACPMSPQNTKSMLSACAFHAC